MTANTQISLMLAVPSAAAAADWYKRALGARELWNLGGVAGLEIDGHRSSCTNLRATGSSPAAFDGTTVRVEVFSDAPDAFIARAVAAGADGSDEVGDHEAPWGVHRQGGFTDPFGHVWLVGDKSPLKPFPG